MASLQPCSKTVETDTNLKQLWQIVNSERRGLTPKLGNSFVELLWSLLKDTTKPISYHDVPKLERLWDVLRQYGFGQDDTDTEPPSSQPCVCCLLVFVVIIALISGPRDDLRFPLSDEEEFLVHRLRVFFDHGNSAPKRGLLEHLRYQLRPSEFTVNEMKRLEILHRVLVDLEWLDNEQPPQAPPSQESSSLESLVSVYIDRVNHGSDHDSEETGYVGIHRILILHCSLRAS